jgi:diguanylate cyclase (GGDEF)-like protein
MNAMTAVRSARHESSSHTDAVRRLARAREEASRLDGLFLAAVGAQAQEVAGDSLGEARACVASRKEWLHWIDEGTSLAPWADGEWAPDRSAGQGPFEVILNPTQTTSHEAGRDAGDADNPAHRDAAARGRDRTSDQRDQAADVRDRDAQAHDEGILEHDARRHVSDGLASVTREQVAIRAVRERERGADERRAAAGQRADAALDREHAKRDRQLAARDRSEAAAAYAAAGVDDLTGALRRGVGLAAMQRELERAHRTNGRLVVAFVDVDGLKGVNDSFGHAAGDRLLERAANLISTHMRPYDIFVRAGGDEFICSLGGIDADSVRERFGLVSADLANGPDAGSISVGLDELRAGDSVDDVINRADVALLAIKSRKGGGVARRPSATVARARVREPIRDTERDVTTDYIHELAVQMAAPSREPPQLGPT